MTRDQYIQKMKSDIDRWNEQITAWEETLREAHGDLRKKLQVHLDAWRDQRNLAAHRLREVKLATEQGWLDVAQGAEQAWRDLAHAYELARQRFEQDRSPRREPKAGAR